MEKIAVLMRTKNSAWVIPQTLTSLFSQENINFTLYIIDSGSTDNTLEICNEFEHQRIEMNSENYVPGPVLNHAIGHISESIIVLLNSDSVLLSPYSLEKLIAPLKNNKNTAATVGRQIPRHDAELWVVRDYHQAFPESGPIPEYLTLSFPLSAIRKNIWSKEKFYEDSWGSEDTEWGKRIVQNGHGKIEYVPAAITMHSHNYTLKELHNRKFIEGEADYFIYGEKPSLLKSFIRFLLRSFREFKYYLFKLNLAGLPKIFIRNFIYFLGHYNGLNSAHYRVKNNIKNVVHKTY